MQKIVLDTNVIVASLISDGIPFKIINELVFGKKVKVCTSIPVYEVYIEVFGTIYFCKCRFFNYW